jgi:hypothetical protein
MTMTMTTTMVIMTMRMRGLALDTALRMAARASCTRAAQLIR